MLSDYQQLFQNALKESLGSTGPKGLYEPISYLLNLGGKRLRPVLTLMAAETFGKNQKEAVGAALAIEIFHNFTLMHDDIMDAAPLRRGAATVHHKWDTNTAILSGDAMLIKAYQTLEAYPDPLFGKLTRLLSQTALEVCEGQQYDMDFETQKEVTEPQYLEMIQLKTAVLVGCALQMGAWIGGASDTDAHKLYEFGVLLGTAFQIQDDYLDAFGDPESFGKQLGGDIIENKKTILYHQAMAKGTAEQKEKLLHWFSSPSVAPKKTEKIQEVKALFEDTGSRIASVELVKKFTEKAFEKIDELVISTEGKELFKGFGLQLMERKF